MSGTKTFTLSNSIKEKLVVISQNFKELNTGSIGDVLWIASDQGNSSYDWGQVDLGVNKNSELVFGYQSGCSCNGPGEPNVDTSYDLMADITLVDDSYYDALEPALDELEKVAEVLVKVFQKKASPKEIISLPNAEIRRAAVEYVGYERITELAEIIDETKTDGRLMEIKLSDDENIRLLQVKDPSTAREYFLRVPPNMKTAKQARAWTFGFKPEDFDLAVES